MNTANGTPWCEYCDHPAHPGAKCAHCKCKGKPGFWQRMFDGLGNAIGETLYGGNR